MVAKKIVETGEFAGWTTYDLKETFDQTVGPFYFRPDPDGSMRVARRPIPALPAELARIIEEQKQ